MGKIPSPPASNANKNGAKSGNAAFGPRDLKKAVGNNNASKGGLLASNKTDSVSPGPGKQVMGGPQGKTPYANEQAAVMGGPQGKTPYANIPSGLQKKK